MINYKCKLPTIIVFDEEQVFWIWKKTTYMFRQYRISSCEVFSRDESQNCLFIQQFFTDLDIHDFCEILKIKSSNFSVFEKLVLLWQPNFLRSPMFNQTNVCRKGNCNISWYWIDGSSLLSSICSVRLKLVNTN